MSLGAVSTNELSAGLGRRVLPTAVLVAAGGSLRPRRRRSLSCPVVE